jgi:proteic killer suppression protein
VIQSFGDAATEDLFNGMNNARTRAFDQIVKQAAHRKFDMLNAASILDDLRSPPGNQLEALKGDLAGFHSIRINKQWRIIFRWTEAGPAEVRIVDYH